MSAENKRIEDEKSRRMMEIRAQQSYTLVEHHISDLLSIAKNNKNLKEMIAKEMTTNKKVNKDINRNFTEQSAKQLETTIETLHDVNTELTLLKEKYEKKAYINKKLQEITHQVPQASSSQAEAAINKNPKLPELPETLPNITPSTDTFNDKFTKTMFKVD
jgi:formyltetrahydrofolate synthetase